MQIYKGMQIIAVDQPFALCNGLLNILNSETVIASVDIKKGAGVKSMLLTGDIGWRVVPFTTADAQGRIEIKIRRNGREIFKAVDDSFVPPGFSCARKITSFVCLDRSPGANQLRYDLTILGGAENADVFRVTGPIAFMAAGLTAEENTP